jgi:hypothetical protein
MFSWAEYQGGVTMGKDELKKCHKAVVVDMYCNYLKGLSTRLTRIRTPGKYYGLWTLETALPPRLVAPLIWDWFHVQVLVRVDIVEKLVANGLAAEVVVDGVKVEDAVQNVVLTAKGAVCAKAWLAEGFGGRVHCR